eukprot:396240-Rhodomonas_salina.1
MSVLLFRAHTLSRSTSMLSPRCVTSLLRNSVTRTASGLSDHLPGTSHALSWLLCRCCCGASETAAKTKTTAYSHTRALSSHAH